MTTTRPAPEQVGPVSDRRTVRQWLAWQLVCIAHRIHDATWVSVVTATSPEGNRTRLIIHEDEYGSGIGSWSGLQWDDDGDTGSLDGWTFEWPDPVRYRDFEKALDDGELDL